MLRVPGRLPRRFHAVRALLGVCLLLAGCSVADDQQTTDEVGNRMTPTVVWYSTPDNGGQRRMAARCNEQAGGAYRIRVEPLAHDSTQQREQLVRRLAARDPSIDILSLDVPYVAEFANAGFLLPLDVGTQQSLAEGVLAGPRATATWQGRLVGAPFLANAQLLWFRKSVARAAGVDPTRPDFTWAEMLRAAESRGRWIGVQGKRYEGYAVWINALILSAGGSLLDAPARGAQAEPMVASPAGDLAAEVVGSLARSSASPPGLSTAGEEESRAAFQSARGGFMVNWPFVWAAARTAVAEGTLDPAVLADIGWARYPRLVPDHPAAPPLGGVVMAVGRWSRHPTAALAAIRCLTSVEQGVAYALDSGNLSTRAAVYDDPRVREAMPMVSLVRDSVDTGGPRPVTPYYADVSAALQRTWHPPRDVRPAATPRRADVLIRRVLHSQALL